MGPREGMHILSPWPTAFSQRSGFCKKSDFSRRTTLKKKEQVWAERARQVGAPLALLGRKGRENPSPLAAGVADFSSKGCTSEEEVSFRACVWGWTEQVSPGGPQGGAAGRESPAFSFAGTEGRGGGGRWKTQLFRGLASAPIPAGSSQQTQLLCSRAREMGGGGTQPSLSWGFHKDRCPGGDCVGVIWKDCDTHCSGPMVAVWRQWKRKEAGRRQSSVGPAEMPGRDGWARRPREADFVSIRRASLSSPGTSPLRTRWQHTPCEGKSVTWRRSALPGAWGGPPALKQCIGCKHLKAGRFPRKICIFVRFLPWKIKDQRWGPQCTSGPPSPGLWVPAEAHPLPAGQGCYGSRGASPPGRAGQERLCATSGVALPPQGGLL